MSKKTVVIPHASPFVIYYRGIYYSQILSKYHQLKRVSISKDKFHQDMVNLLKKINK